MKKKYDMEKINQLMLNDLQIVDKIIREDFGSKVPLINEISEYIIAGKGKRIRPLLTLLCGRIAGVKDGNLLHKMAAMIEYIHTATLLHDDVVDESNLRRGKKTANSAFGNAAAVLVGDFIYTRAFQMMIESKNIRLLEVMANSTNTISEGEVLQLLNIGRQNLSEEEYFQIINYKTATLFEAAAKVASIIAQSNREMEQHLASYANNLGIAFQIVDDILDYTGENSKIGKNIGDDLIEGKITLPIIYLLKYGTKEEVEILKKTIIIPDDFNIRKVILLIKNSNAIGYCNKLALNFVTNAIDHLNIFPSSIYKDALVELANIAINRIH
ncbi:MAG TPA: polyprenyl synthetase family protein [Burkholderiales bacterium]|nr:polyprenyl synthetase family protein [Burkholderiales bacterium]